MPRAKVAYQLHLQHTTTQSLLDGARRLDELGVHAILASDHMFPFSGSPDGPTFECNAVLAAIAVVTRRAQIGALVNGNSYRNPELLAFMTGTIDHLSGGRAILGVGAGWARRDYEQYGYEFGTVQSRLRDFEEALPRIRSRLKKLTPPPVGPVPILIGGGGERVTLRLVAQYADMWHGFGDAEQWGRKNRVLDDWCDKVGRDPKTIERMCGAAGFEDRELDALIEAGAQTIVMEGDDPVDFGRVERLLERYS
jgi:probable F420-dependent oxidoreductase